MCPHVNLSALDPWTTLAVLHEGKEGGGETEWKKMMVLTDGGLSILLSQSAPKRS